MIIMKLSGRITCFYVISVFFTTPLCVEGVPTEKCANGLYLDTALTRCKYCNEHCPWVGFQAIPQACSTYCLTSTTAPTTTTPPNTKTGVPLNTPAIIAICLACGICVTGIVGLLWMFVPACQTTRKTPFQDGLTEEGVTLTGVQENNTGHNSSHHKELPCY